MIVINVGSRNTIALAEYINNNVGRDKKVVLFDSVKEPYLQLQINREYEHYIIEHPFEELLQDLSNENAQEIIKNADVIAFDCNVSTEDLEKLDETRYNQDILITVQSDKIGNKIIDTKNV